MSTDSVLGSISIFDIAAEADATNRGFVIQYLDTVGEWLLAIGTNRVIYCEVHDDVSVVDPDLNSRRYRQIKSYLSTGLGFGDQAVKHSVYLFYRNALRLIDAGEDLDQCSFELAIHGTIRKKDTLLKSWALTGHPPTVAQGVEALKECVLDRLNNRHREKQSPLLKKKTEGDAQATKDLAALAETHQGELNRIDAFPWNTFTSRVTFTVSSESVEDRHRELVRFIEHGKFTLVPASVVVARCFQAVALRACKPNPEDRALTQQELEGILAEDEQQMISNLQSDERIGVRILAELTKHSAALRNVQTEVRAVLTQVHSIEDNTRLIPKVANEITSVGKKLDLVLDLSSYRNNPTRPDLSFPLISRVLERLEKYLQGEELWDVDPNDETLDPPDDLETKLRANNLQDEHDVITILTDAFADFMQIQAYLRRNMPASRQRAMFSAIRRKYRNHKDQGMTPRKIFNQLIEDIIPTDANEEYALACEVFIAYLFHACEVFERADSGQV